MEHYTVYVLLYSVQELHTKVMSSIEVITFLEKLTLHLYK